MPLGKGIFLNESVKEGYLLLKVLILPLLARLACKQLQISTDMLLIIISTGDELFTGIYSVNLKRP